MSKYKIGDEVWYAALEHGSKRSPCPDCSGKRYLRVILGDDSEVTINCQGCAQGYNLPTGFVEIPELTAHSRCVKIQGFETVLQEGQEVTIYHFEGCYRADEKKLFLVKEEAEAKARQLGQEETRREVERLSHKFKNYRSWAWHVHYYRSEIERAEKNIAQYKQQLNAALQHQKDKAKT